MTIEKFPGHFASGNGTPRNQQGALAGNPKDRMQNLKYAIFYLVGATILFLANRVSTHPAGEVLTRGGIEIPYTKGVRST